MAKKERIYFTEMIEERGVETEKELIEALLEENGVGKTAEILGVSYATLRNRAKEHGIPTKRSKAGPINRPGRGAGDRLVLDFSEFPELKRRLERISGRMIERLETQAVLYEILLLAVKGLKRDRQAAASQEAPDDGIID